ncbi:HPP family protein [Pedococcus sp.]|jgi:CBS domain-containing protein|uniref:CBS domain-containing protein n=1 Tax=Pedococcus sp. TaxID=2860345 RepID=UPI002E13FAE3|nr:CBS domain-containing protein [Pedococcus sp.]
MFVRDLMTSPATSLPTGTRLDVAITIMATQHITAVPIVDARHHVVGVVTEGDVIKDNMRSQGSLVLPPEVPHVRAEDRRVDEVMTPDPVTVQENADVDHVIRVFATTAWKSLPVVRRRRLIGVISRSDVVRALATPDAEIVRQVKGDFARIGHEEWDVLVGAGVVTVRGPQQANDTRLATAIAQTIPGVRGVVINPPPEAGDERGLELRRLHRRPPAHTMP